MVQDVALGESHSTVLTTDGEVLTTGAANYGRLGNGETSEDTLYFDSVEILPGETVVQIAGGESFTLALTKEGVIYGWGRNHKGQLGTGFGMSVDMYAMEQIPTPMDGDELINRTVTKIAAGTNHGACVTSNGELFCWGSSLHLEPVRVTEVLHTKIVDVECGLDYTMALSEDHELFVWGAGKTGVLGQGPDTKTLHQAQMIKSLLKKDNTIVSMSAGSNLASCMVLEV
ncbi:RCC1/BLIP-II protein [Fragilariopsis cylindrus CCMP1102]|uniref:RCC1/BLIP-II protein n=1 Tax=Fragilariopsis cylindrus CCMP1102 TaxID=635003 RepID=A0A1E7ET12_9STRA|nr:RCC1/BLIP-II protein [Fragilariopsis cylindrus CCMP1102]|eukprot:OEU08977.1 RCC1/BLIP-II protein [Fragilariopsis cylindrus CCMP1102]